MEPANPENPSATASNDRFHDLLIAEYEYVAEALLRNEEGGEKRASFFVGLTGATLAVLAVIFKEGAKLSWWTAHLVLALALAFLLLFGWLTALRLAYRNQSTDRFIRRLDSIRKHFLKGESDPRRKSLGYNPYEPRDRAKEAEGALRKGGWLETTFVMNLLLAGALGATVADGIMVLLAGPPIWPRAAVDAFVAAAAGSSAWWRQCAMRERVVKPS
jgi:hypothetical protein